MEFVYAEVDEDGVVFAVSSVSAMIEKPTMIQVPAFDETLLGKVHVGDGVFEDAQE